MKITTALLFFVLAGFIICSCEYEFIQPEEKPIPENVSFANDIIPIFNNGCNTNVCHGPGSTPPDLSPDNAYDALMSGGYVDTETPEASILYTSMKSGSMKPYTTPGDEDIILAWIEQGAKNN
jgi:hypothetical protein